MIWLLWQLGEALVALVAGMIKMMVGVLRWMTR